MGDTRRGVLLVGFGGPESLDGVPAFVESVLRRRPRQTVVDGAVRRYAAIGGRSPLPDTTRRQGHLLAGELARREVGWTVTVGMLHAPPTIDQGIDRMVARGVDELVAISLAPYRCEVSTDAYEAAVQTAVSAQHDGLSVCFPKDWNLHPEYVAALAETLAASLADVPPATPVVFTAHSLPQRMIQQGDPYADQLAATAAAVAHQAGVGEWYLAYQSVSAAASEPWLGPSVEEVIDRLATEGREAVVVDPIGFVSDHLETLYDNDIEHHAHAERLGVAFHRCRCLNDHPGLIAALADIALTTDRG
jgi:protoporphyrin/coproporphyrin ferrochelatase